MKKGAYCTMIAAACSAMVIGSSCNDDFLYHVPYTVGGSCAFDNGGAVCSEDGSAILECVDGIFELFAGCGVDGACRFIDTQPNHCITVEECVGCEPVVPVEVGGSCPITIYPSYTLDTDCSSDGRAVLDCDGTQWQVREQCAPGTSCGYAPCGNTFCLTCLP